MLYIEWGEAEAGVVAIGDELSIRDSNFTVSEATGGGARARLPLLALAPEFLEGAGSTC